jgi:hypothetical protein
MDRPKTLVITSDVPHKNMSLLCPSPDGILGEWQILYNPQKGTRCDFWIVFTASRHRDWMQCAPENTLYLAGEPPSKKVHPESFYAQFHYVYSCNPKDPHPRVEVGAPCLNWHVGLDTDSHEYRFGSEHLSGLKSPQKINKISVVCSNLTTTEGQRKRLEFLDYLKSELGDSIIHFGRGFTPIPDKFEAILPYAYHLVLENSQTAHYWTEKLSDAYLGYAFPFYLGAPNIHEYFSPDALIQLNAEDPGQAVREMKSALAGKLYNARQADIERARHLILNKYNIFSLSSDLASKHFNPDAGSQKKVITTHKAFRPFPRNILYHIKALTLQ